MKAQVAATMKAIGASLWSSQWEGWVPGAGCPGYSGKLESSVYTVRTFTRH